MPASLNQLENAVQQNPPTSAAEIVRGCLESLDRCIVLVERLAPGQYGAKPAGHSSIGAHMRHCLDHFTQFSNGLEDDAIDYDARMRDERLETDPALMIRALESAKKAIADIGEGDLTRALPLRQIPALGAEAIEVETTVQRELLFLAGHAIHHLALMNLLAELQGAPADVEIGVAYSTAEWRKSPAGRTR